MKECVKIRRHLKKSLWMFKDLYISYVLPMIVLFFHSLTIR